MNLTSAGSQATPSREPSAKLSSFSSARRLLAVPEYLCTRPQTPPAQSWCRAGAAVRAGARISHHRIQERRVPHLEEREKARGLVCVRECVEVRRLPVSSQGVHLEMRDLPATVRTLPVPILSNRHPVVQGSFQLLCVQLVVSSCDVHRGILSDNQRYKGGPAGDTGSKLHGIRALSTGG